MAAALAAEEATGSLDPVDGAYGTAPLLSWWLFMDALSTGVCHESHEQVPVLATSANILLKLAGSGCVVVVVVVVAAAVVVSEVDGADFGSSLTSPVEFAVAAPLRTASVAAPLRTASVGEEDTVSAFSTVSATTVWLRFRAAAGMLDDDMAVSMLLLLLEWLSDFWRAGPTGDAATAADTPLLSALAVPGAADMIAAFGNDRKGGSQ